MPCLLRGVRDDDVPAVVVFREAGAVTAAVLDGLLRFQVSRALGFVLIPATQPSREDAEPCYGYVG
jgi:hypothetical protein